VRSRSYPGREAGDETAEAGPAREAGGSPSTGACSRCEQRPGRGRYESRMQRDARRPRPASLRPGTPARALPDSGRVRRHVRISCPLIDQAIQSEHAVQCLHDSRAVAARPLEGRRISSSTPFFYAPSTPEEARGPSAHHNDMSAIVLLLIRDFESIESNYRSANPQVVRDVRPRPGLGRPRGWRRGQGGPMS